MSYGLKSQSRMSRWGMTPVKPFEIFDAQQFLDEALGFLVEGFAMP
jgi:hypothetical protein